MKLKKILNIKNISVLPKKKNFRRDCIINKGYIKSDGKSFSQPKESLKWTC